MGATIDEAMANATEALREWMGDRVAGGHSVPNARMPEALRTDSALAEDVACATLATVPLLLDAGRSVRVNLSLDAATLDEIDTAAKLRGLTRSAFLVSAARSKILAEG